MKIKVTVHGKWIMFMLFTMYVPPSLPTLIQNFRYIRQRGQRLIHFTKQELWVHWLWRIPALPEVGSIVARHSRLEPNRIVHLIGLSDSGRNLLIIKVTNYKNTSIYRPSAWVNSTNCESLKGNIYQYLHSNIQREDSCFKSFQEEWV